MVEHEVQGETKHFFILKRMFTGITHRAMCFHNLSVQMYVPIEVGTFCGPDINDAVITSMY